MLKVRLGVCTSLLIECGRVSRSGVDCCSSGVMGRPNLKKAIIKVYVHTYVYGCVFNFQHNFKHVYYQCLHTSYTLQMVSTQRGMLDLPRYRQYLRIRRRWNRYQYDTTPCLMSVPCVFAAGCRATHERVQSYYTTYKNIKHPYCLKIQFYLFTY